MQIWRIYLISLIICIWIVLIKLAKYKDNKKMTYKVYSKVDNIRQLNTIINLTNVADSNIYNHISETLRDRFNGYRVSINHVGQTVSIDYI